MCLEIDREDRGEGERRQRLRPHDRVLVKLGRLDVRKGRLEGLVQRGGVRGRLDVDQEAAELLLPPRNLATRDGRDRGLGPVVVGRALRLGEVQREPVAGRRALLGSTRVRRLLHRDALVHPELGDVLLRGRALRGGDVLEEELLDRRRRVLGGGGRAAGCFLRRCWHLVVDTRGFQNLFF